MGKYPKKQLICFSVSTISSDRLIFYQSCLFHGLRSSLFDICFYGIYVI